MINGSVINGEAINGVTAGSVTPPIPPLPPLPPPAPISGGAENDTNEALLRKYLNPALRGPAWNALIAAIATGDAYTRETTMLAFDQLFTSTASGMYLDRKASNVGLTRPPTIGISEDVFRKLAIKTTASKLTHEVILEALEVYYGPDATRANVTTQAHEPFRIVDGGTLLLQIDDEPVLTVTFKKTDFAIVGQGTAIEVAAAITRAMGFAGFTAKALALQDPSTGTSFVRLYTGTLGLRGSMRVLGGSAQSVLSFPAELNVYG